MDKVIDNLEAQIAALDAELARDEPRYRGLLRMREALAELKPATADSVKAPPGFKLVPLTKEEKVRIETAAYLRTHQYRAHRNDIAAHLVSIGVLANDAKPVESLSVYLTRWDEIESQGRGWYVLRMVADVANEKQGNSAPAEKSDVSND